MAKDNGPMSGFRDLLSSQMLARQKVLDSVARVYELYGFMPIKTPAIERYETLNGKYGSEATALIYDFKDHGDRHIALRYDHTVPLSRLMAGSSKSLPSPYKRYVIGDVWRGESPQAGRYREFTQIDADIVGSDSYLSDTEILLMTNDVFKALKTEVSIFVNDRRLLDGLAEECGVKGKSGFYKFIGVIDKVDKIGDQAVLKEIAYNYGAEAKDKVSKLFNIKGDRSFDEVLNLVDNPKAREAVESLKKIFETIKELGYTDIQFKPTISRGLNYYTSTIFEAVINKVPEIGSVCAGGRYDELIGQLRGPDLPAVGTSIGLDRLMEGLSRLSDDDIPKTKTKVYITNLDMSLNSERLSIASKLRDNSIPTEVYYSDAKLGKQFESISKLGVNTVLIYGQDEHNKGVVVIKDLKTSDQREIKLSDLVTEVMKVR